MGYITETAVEGDTWAAIAQRAYGDTTKIPDLIAANAHIPARPIIKAGTVIRCAVVDREDTATNYSNLPPWKRP